MVALVNRSYTFDEYQHLKPMDKLVKSDELGNGKSNRTQDNNYYCFQGKESLGRARRSAGNELVF